jgi:hypothetical protein
MKKEDEQVQKTGKPIKRKKDVDLPGLGQFYCIACEFVSTAFLPSFLLRTLTHHLLALRSSFKTADTFKTRLPWRLTMLLVPTREGNSRPSFSSFSFFCRGSLTQLFCSDLVRLKRLKEEQHRGYEKIDNGMPSNKTAADVNMNQ